MKSVRIVRHRSVRLGAGAAAVTLTAAIAGWVPPARASSGYPNPDCTIPAGDYYDFYDDCAAYTNWGKYFPDGAINSGPWSVELPTALGDTIAAVSYDGKPYIQGIAHGTEMGFNFHEDTEHSCYNPTEPGAWDDDTTAKWGAGWNQFPWLGPSTTAILAAPSYSSATSVTTVSRLAMWLSAGEDDGHCPGGASYPAGSPYSYQLSPYVLTKTVTVGPLPELPSLPDVMRIDGSLQVESTPGGTSRADGVFIAFLRCNFTSWLKLSPGSDTFDPVPDPDSTPAVTTLGAGQSPVSGQDMDVLVAATSDGSQAFALYAPTALNSAAPYGETQFAWLQDSPAGCGYGKQLSDQITFYGAPGAGRPAGTYAYRVYAAFGTLEQVKTAVQTMRDDAALEPSHVRPLSRPGESGSMIAKTFFLAKIIHRILIRSLRGKKNLHENLAAYRIFSTLRAASRGSQRTRIPGFEPHDNFVIHASDSCVRLHLAVTIRGIVRCNRVHHVLWKRGGNRCLYRLV